MTDYTWRPKGLLVRAQGTAVEPLVAFKHFVLPGMRNINWIEDSSKITDTGMSMREWIGLIIHAIALTDLTGDESLMVAKMVDNDDGGLVRRGKEAVYVEQTLATHKDKRYKSLLEAVAGQVQRKSFRGQNYADNRHLIVFCNINGDMQEEELARVISNGKFNVVNVFGFNSNNRHYLSLLFDKDEGLIHKCVISEKKLIKAAEAIPEKPGTQRN